MVLHTWGQRLQHHPHVHCVVPAGGLAPDGARWIHARPTFFLPVKVLRQVFRGKLVAGLRDALRRAACTFPARSRRSPLRALSRVAPIPLSPRVGGVREATLWQPEPCLALPRALHPPRRHLESPARRRDRRHRRLSVEGLSTREPDPHAHARGRRIPAPLSPPHPPEALRPHPLLRLPRVALSYASWLSVVRRSPSHQRHRTNRSLLHRHDRRGRARAAERMRIVERLTARQLFLEALLAVFMTPRSRARVPPSAHGRARTRVRRRCLLTARSPARAPAAAHAWNVLTIVITPRSAARRPDNRAPHD